MLKAFAIGTEAYRFGGKTLCIVVAILTVGKKKFYNATFGDMLTAIKNVYGKTPNFDNLRV